MSKVKDKRLGLPDTLYIRKDQDGDDTYFIASESQLDAIDDNDDGPTVVGTYTLEGALKLYKQVAVADENEG